MRWQQFHTRFHASHGSIRRRSSSEINERRWGVFGRLPNYMRARNCECAWWQSIFFLCQVVFVRRKRIHIATKVQSVRFAGSQYIKSPSSIQARIGERLTMKANILVKKVLLDTQQHSFSNRVRRSHFLFIFSDQKLQCGKKPKLSWLLKSVSWKEDLKDVTSGDLW